MYTMTCGILLLGNSPEIKKVAQFTAAMQDVLNNEKISRILFENNNHNKFTQIARNLIPKSTSLELVSCYAPHIDYSVLYTEYDQIHNIPPESSHTSVHHALFTVRKFVIDNSDIVIYNSAFPSPMQERIQKYLSRKKGKILIDIARQKL